MPSCQLEKPPLTLERLISRVLRTGVFLSVAVMLLGVILTLAQRPGPMAAEGRWQQQVGSQGAFSLAQTGAGLKQCRGEAFIVLGLLLLIGTPVVRVVVAVAMFAKQRDWRYLAVTAVALVVLLASFFLGRAK